VVGEKTGRDALWRARELSLAGLLGALGLLLPIGFHMLGWAGKVFQPMHLPILVAGFLLGPGTAAAVGLLTPLLSAVLTGMPPLSPPIAPLMSVELAAKAVVASLLYRRLRLPLWFVLPVAIVVDWVVLAAAAAAAGGFFRIEAAALTYVGLIIAVSWPGTLLQLFGAPLAVRTIERRVPRLAAERRRR
jgi:hypothetical protein